MYVCMYVYIYITNHIYVHICIYTYIYTYIWVCVFIDIHTDRSRSRSRYTKHTTTDSNATSISTSGLTRDTISIASSSSSPLKVPCSYKLTAMGKFALLRYLSEFRFQVSDGDHQRCILDLPMKPGTIRNKWLKSRNWNRRSLWVTVPKALVHAE